MGVAAALVLGIAGVALGVILSRERIGKAIEEEEFRRKMGVFSKGAIVIDGEGCAQIGYDVIRENGTAVDAAIAALFCNGIVTSHSMGVGGGFVMTIYSKKFKNVTTIIAREWAPGAASENMFNSNSTLSQEGGLSIAVPGEVKGYYEAKLKFGNEKIPWSRLVQPAIDIARNGIRVSKSAAAVLKENKAKVLKDPGMRAIFINPKTNDVWREGEVYKRQRFADTLEEIAKDPMSFYTGNLAKRIVRDIKRVGGIITEEDLRLYNTSWDTAPSIKLLNGESVYSTPAPSSGPILLYILNILKNFSFSPRNTPDDEDDLLNHIIIESFKWAYGLRSHLGDPANSDITGLIHDLVYNMTSDGYAKDTFLKINLNHTYNDPSFYGGDFFVPGNHGTAHATILAPDGDAVSVTSTINLHFGSGFMSEDTGIIFNDEMDDFSSPNITNEFGLPPSPNNFIKPYLRPVSSMSPAIVVDKNGDVKLVIGASGGSRITTAVAYATVRNLWFGQDIKKSIDARRIHHQLLPMVAFCEDGISQEIVNGLKKHGHKVSSMKLGKSVIQGIAVLRNGLINAYSDFRKSGSVYGV